MLHRWRVCRLGKLVINKIKGRKVSMFLKWVLLRKRQVHCACWLSHLICQLIKLFLCLRQPWNTLRITSLRLSILLICIWSRIGLKIVLMHVIRLLGKYLVSRMPMKYHFIFLITKQLPWICLDVFLNQFQSWKSAFQSRRRIYSTKTLAMHTSA